MNWFGAGVDGPLVAIRAIHFAATTVTAGTLVFRAVVSPAVRRDQALATQFRAQTLRTAWIGLAFTFASGVIWLLVEAASMSGLPFAEAMTGSVLATVLGQTQFGLVAEIRLGLAIILAACLADRIPLAHWLAPAAALGLAAAIAWTGHAGSTPGDLGNLHLLADALHLAAASAWVGGLVPLVLLLALARRYWTADGASLAWQAAIRFSILGIISVGTLAATGVINTWILVGSLDALVSTGYGRLLMLKLGVLAVMLAFAAINRFWLTPRLVGSSGDQPRLEALGQLTRNSGVEIVLGFVIFAIVGMLGTMHPAIHLA